MTTPRKLVTTTGQNVLISREIASRGQGTAYKALMLDTRKKGVVKLFKEQFRTDSTRRRVEYLVGHRFSERCPIIAGPSHTIADGSHLGHFSPYAEGTSLDQLLQKGSVNPVQSIQMGIALTHAVGVMHDENIAHGDLHSENVLVQVASHDVLIPHLIDLDNFNAPDQPPPDMVGQNLYLAPEQREAIAAGKPAVPDVYTDRFQLGILIHEAILLKHPATGADHDEAAFHEAMCRGQWIHDPCNGGEMFSALGGCPPGILGTELSRLFRRSLSLDRSSRPTASEWKEALQRALMGVFVCSRCNGSFVGDAYSFSCPHCKTPFPKIVIVAPAGRAKAIEGAAVSIGRDSLDGNPTVSAQHAIFRRRGPVTYVEARGRNGTYRWDGKSWVKLPDRTLIAVKAGDRLRFGELDVQLRETG
jgi:serine/threonine protein kinase